MSITPARTHHIPAQTITSSGNTGTGVNAIKNLSDLSNPRIVTALINFPNAPTGTTPSLTPSLLVSVDGNVWYTAKAGAAQTASGTQRIVAMDVIEPFVQVAWVVTGTTPAFPGVTIDILHN